MINRIIIRIKVLQIVYAFYQKGSKDLKSAENELMRSFEQSYNLYRHLLYLVVVLTDAEQKRLDALKHKFLPTEEERNPNTRLADNQLAEQIRQNESLNSFINNNGNFWNTDDPVFIKDLLNAVVTSDTYKEYLLSENSYESDRSFWQKTFKNILLKNENLAEYINENNIYIDDELELIGSFTIKTIKRFETTNGKTQDLLPMFKEDEDREYAIKLLHHTIIDKQENEELINKQIKNWDLERIALMDLLIMQIALAELKSFSSIPIHVTLNEYIDLARYYSTPQSARFINGILDAIVKELKSGGTLIKS